MELNSRQSSSVCLFVWQGKEVHPTKCKKNNATVVSLLLPPLFALLLVMMMMNDE